MKLKELIEAIELELESAALGDKRARLSLAFSAKKSAEGELVCDFVDASSLSRARAEELHRLDVILGKKKSGATSSPRHQIAESVSPPLAKRSDFERVRPEIGELDSEDPDTPAYFRKLFPQS